MPRRFLLVVAYLAAAGCRREHRTPTELGRYLVDHLYGCNECHTPRGADGSPDRSRYLAGVECLFDVDPAPGRGCIHSRNLTNHPRGLANVTDDRAVKDMFLQGRRPDGRLLHPAMPAWEMHAMPPEHADAIVAYLRTVPGVDHLVPASEPPFDVPPVTLPAPMDLALVPPVPTGAPKAAHRGRAMVAVACVGCHSPSPPERRADGLAVDPTRLFAGGRAFTASRMGQLMPALPAKVYSRNLTQHETGLRGWSEDDVVRVLKHGRDPKGRGVCAPMMGGPGREYGGLTDEDAHAIASYILTLPGIDNRTPRACEAP